MAVFVASATTLFEPWLFKIHHLWVVLPHQMYAPIVMRSLLAVMLHNQTGFRIAERLLGYRWSALALFPILILYLEFGPLDLRGLPNLLVHSLMVCILAALVIREDNVGMGFLRLSWIARFGMVSYGIYLYHHIALAIVREVFGVVGITGRWVVLLTYSALSYVIAEISFRTLEAYFRRFRPAYRDRKAQPAE